MSRHWSTADIPDQSGRRAVVTGANAGLGLVIARELARAGAHVVLACRNTEKAESAAASVRSQVPRASLEVRRLDLADLASVEAFAAEVAGAGDHLDLLINNAGLMAVDESRTADGFEMQLGVNHLGHFALTARLLPLLLATPGSRVATMSSLGHRMGQVRHDDLMFERRGYSRWDAYYATKLANLLFTAELHRRLVLAGAGTIAVAAHPGFSATDLGSEGGSLSNRLTSLAMPLAGHSPEVGALAMLRAATAPDVQGGEFYGPRFIARGWPVRETPSRRARDDADARRLWAASEDLTHLSPVLHG